MALTNAVVAPRYGTALYALARETNQVDLINEELQQLKAVCDAAPQLLAALDAPELTPAAKQQLIDTLKKDAIQPVANLIQMTFDYGRIGALPAIIDDFAVSAQADAGIVEGTVTSAVPLSDQQAQQLSSAIAAKLSAKTAHLTPVVDASVLGGVRVEAANRIIDGTVAHRIQQMRAALLAH
ncbi:ATP synthase F1 subunit delta [Lacticaseibacillus sharpeae]|uniref:ATP synthase subunit delta n=1 Tax=Lacticaseibacillus sharpeae JCM 1186 = DSM 20505 TaxID=1291052 RepID=A0A0R1ZPV7_9LACO|nr:ATP synthase F1 subunit delta [Lacticaseibacillus sharpeae]KRM56533.1 H(+)-transporting two-sector ATPase (ATP synthase), subunit delta [Lacticaseibacillus sharpeae JCM 1186 = DSM 20505]